MSKFIDHLKTFIIYYIAGVFILGVFNWVKLPLDDYDYLTALIAAIVLIIFDVVVERREKREEGVSQVTLGLHLSQDKLEFMKLNRHNEELINEVRYMTDEDFEKFISPYYQIFNDNFREDE